MYKKLLVLFAMGFMIAIFSVASNANPDGPKITSPAQYSEQKIGATVEIFWTRPDTSYGNVSYYNIAYRKFAYNVEDVNDSNEGELIATNYWSSAQTRYPLPVESDSKYRVSICAIMADGTKRWSDHLYIYVAAHNTPIDKPISFHFYNGLTSQSKEQIYYACQNWNNSLNIGRKIVNTYPLSNGTNNANSTTDDGFNVVTKQPLGADGPLMVTYYRYYVSSGRMVEADIFVNTDVPWANSTTPEKYNFYNVITHEIGHVIGLCDIYEPWGSEWTMYGYADKNEGKKTTLEAHDITYGKALYD